MSLRDEFTTKPVPLLTTRGFESTVVHVYGYLAVHEVLSEQYCEIIHTPSGSAFPARFSDIDAAMRACRDMERMRDDWLTFDLRALPVEQRNPVRRRMRAIVDRHHGTWMANRRVSDASAPIFDAAQRAIRSVQ